MVQVIRLEGEKHPKTLVKLMKPTTVIKCLKRLFKFVFAGEQNRTNVARNALKHFNQLCSLR